LGFWRYDIEANQWDSMTGVPLGRYNKRVKGGTDMVFASYKDTGCVYLLKGYKTEFYRYNPVAGRWDTLPEVPYGANKQKYDKGSFLVYDGVNYIYAHQAKYNDGTNHYMFKYDLGTGQWQTAPLKGMPLAGLQGGSTKDKKSKDGASGAWYDGGLYALKGGNTQHFYRYAPESNSWAELETVPGNGSAGSKKYVKAGGDLVAYGGGAFFALKGNKTYEFWRYVQGTLQASRLTPQARSGVQTGKSAVSSLQLAISPSPITAGFVTLRYSLPKPGPVSITVFDIAGRAVLRQFGIGNLVSGITLDLRKVPAGVYLVRFDADGLTQTQKLVVQK
ncbi:MAG: T9SS type A sorting domain-containing protein, partial [candidate division WOR-3 bacterium]